MSIVLLAASCAPGAREAALVGSKVSDVAAELGVNLESWAPSISGGYEVSCDPDHLVTLFGGQGTLCVVRSGAKVAAVDFRMPACDDRQYDALRASVTSVFGLGPPTDPDVYVVRPNGVVHVRRDRDGARVILTDAPFGKMYVAQVLRDGFADLSNGLRAH